MARHSVPYRPSRSGFLPAPKASGNASTPKTTDDLLCAFSASTARRHRTLFAINHFNLVSAGPDSRIHILSFACAVSHMAVFNASCSV
ncbi:hypothetical protein KCP77_10670 [Salmonella enterica subsp. enterica]|nr:hypothetical protein KCP77_10670 [Salmonella enterica subsp. enterica]